MDPNASRGDSGRNKLGRVKGLAVLAVSAAAAFTAAPPSAGAPTCSPTGAKAAVRATKLRLNLLGPIKVRVDPTMVDRVVCFDFTRDGRLDLGVTIASGGTAGDVGWAVFVRTRTGWRVGASGDGYKLTLKRVGGDFEIVQPVYKTNDPNCCPTGGWDHVRHHWNGTRFVVTRAFHTKTFRR